jgi:subtilisin family serine protease
VDAVALTADSSDRIPDRYIVTLAAGVGPREFAAGHGLAPDFVYGTVLNGFAGYIPAARLSALEQDSRVVRVEQDGVARAIAQTIPWGISNIGATTNSTRAGDGTGTVSGPTVFIIDTGIDTGHTDLNVIGHVNYAGGKNADCNGHGTHVSGTVGAKDNAQDVVGVAPGVAVYGVKVLGCSGSGTWSGVISGMDFAANSTAARKVANMSLGGGFSQSVNDAAANMVNHDVAVAVAAGNSGVDAKDSSPASEPSVLTVAAYDSSSVEPSWSNFGAVVDLAAPGVSVLSTKMGGGTTTMSGTSMATPHVVGALALYRANNASASASQAMTAVKNNTSGTTSPHGFGKLYVGNW